MSFLRREPRAVYRVYEEDEYLDADVNQFGAPLDVSGTAPQPTAEPATLGPPPAEPPAFGPPRLATLDRDGSRRLAALVGAGLIVFVTACVAVIVLHASVHGAHPRAMARSAPAAPAKSPRADRRMAAARPASARMRGQRSGRAGGTRSGLAGDLGQAGGSRPGLSGGAPRLPIALREGSTGDSAGGRGGMSAPSTSSTTTTDEPAVPSSAAVAPPRQSAEATSRSARVAGGEFGFER